MRTSTTEDGGIKIRIPTKLGKAISYGKLTGTIIGIITAAYLFIAAIYAIPVELKAHEDTLKAHGTTLIAYDKQLQMLDESRIIKTEAINSIKDSLLDIKKSLEVNDRQYTGIKTELTKATVSLSYLEKNINMLMLEVKEMNKAISSTGEDRDIYQKYVNETDINNCVATNTVDYKSSAHN